MKVLCLFAFIIVVYIVMVAIATDQSKRCTLPPFPSNGTYRVMGHPTAKPGDVLTAFRLDVICERGYIPPDKNILMCVFGIWSGEMPQCQRACLVPSDSEILYYCLDGDKMTKACSEYEPNGTVMKPVCKSNLTQVTESLPVMTCVDGNWDHRPSCLKECGIVDDATTLEDSLKTNPKRRFPWHVTVYRKEQKFYKRICGGSLISTSAVLTAAHCFFNPTYQESAPNASMYSVVTGKTILEGWVIHEQILSVKQINIQNNYEGSLSSLYADIAIMTLKTKIIITNNVLPVCISFATLDKDELHNGDIGQVSVWPNIKDKNESLHVINVNYMPYDICRKNAPASFKEFLTVDKICAETPEGEISRGNSGSGLSFPKLQNGRIRYYLRGIVSVAPMTPEKTDKSQRTPFVAFTDIFFYPSYILNINNQ